MIKILSRIIPVFLILVSSTLSQTDYGSQKFKINKSHLDYLYQEITIDGKAMGIIHIYSDYPSYNFVDAKGEGYACVDDAARAALFYFEYYKAHNDSKSLQKFNMLTNFVLHMQAANGFFYNFLESDNSINKTYRTSVAEPNWWSWRALWLLTEGYEFYKEKNPERSKILLGSINKCVEAIKRNIPGNNYTKIVDGIKVPEWLPAGSGTDQAALLVIALTNYYQFSCDKSILPYISSLVKGILMMQVNDENSTFNGAFLSWENTWHAWGNSQAYALLKSLAVLKDKRVKLSALKELNHFYPFLYKNNFLSYFKLKHSDSKISATEENKFSQIAYDIRPMVFALLEAYHITRDSHYAEEAGKVARWYTGHNPAKAKIYHGDTGIVYDGIISGAEVNKNSGAESTIETLWSLLRISQNQIALKKFLGKN